GDGAPVAVGGCGDPGSYSGAGVVPVALHGDGVRRPDPQSVVGGAFAGWVEWWFGGGGGGRVGGGRARYRWWRVDSGAGGELRVGRGETAARSGVAGAAAAGVVGIVGGRADHPNGGGC